MATLQIQPPSIRPHDDPRAEASAAPSLAAEWPATTRRDETATSIRIGFDALAEREETLDWLARGLRPGRPGRLRAEYPLLLGENSSAVPVVLYASSLPRSACTLWPVTFRVGDAALRVGLISLVYTDPNARGLGYARRVVERAIQEAERRELALVMLWSEADELYRDLGFHEAGAESLLVLDRTVVDRAIASAAHASGELTVPEAPAARTAPMSATETDWRDIARARAARTSQLEFGEDDLARLRAIPDMRAVCLRDARGRFGFAIRGRGDDLAEVIHEWGGETELALRCCRALLEERAPDHELILLGPVERTEVAWSLRRGGARLLRESLAWLRIASPKAFAEDLRRLDPEATPFALAPSESSAADSTREFEVSDDRTTLRVSEPTLLHAIFGDGNERVARESARQLEPILNTASSKRFPLPFFVWGLESI